MNIILNNSVQNHAVWQKGAGQVNSAKERDKTDRPQGQGSDGARDIKETFDIRNSSQRSIESKQHGCEIKNAKEAEDSLEDVIGLINSESERAHQVHHLNPENLIHLL